MEKGRQMKECKRKMGREGWAGTVVTPKCCREMWQRTELKPKCCCRWGGRHAELRVPWLHSHFYLLFYEARVSLTCGVVGAVTYLASSLVLLLKQVPARQAPGCWAAVLRASSSRVKSRGWTSSQDPTVPARSPRVKKGLKELIQILHFILRRGLGGGGWLLLAFLVLFLGFVVLWGFFSLIQVSTFSSTGAGNFGFH